jgi:hypothetical protein
LIGAKLVLRINKHPILISVLNLITKPSIGNTDFSCLLEQVRADEKEYVNCGFLSSNSKVFADRGLKSEVPDLQGPWVSRTPLILQTESFLCLDHSHTCIFYSEGSCFYVILKRNGADL